MAQRKLSIKRVPFPAVLCGHSHSCQVALAHALRSFTATSALPSRGESSWLEGPFAGGRMARSVGSLGVGTLLCGMLWIHPQALAATDAAVPPLLLANTYHHGIDLARYWVSEKYD